MFAARDFRLQIRRSGVRITPGVPFTVCDISSNIHNMDGVNYGFPVPLKVATDAVLPIFASSLSRCILSASLG